MTKRTRMIETFEVEGQEANLIEVELRYEQGGYNYFTGRSAQRGFYLSVMPYTVKHDGMFQSRCYKGFSGTKMLIEAAGRFSAKKLTTLTVDETTIDELVQHVLDTNNLKRVNTAKAA